MTLAWWVCVVVGLGLLLVELLTMSFVLVWFGLGALIVGLISAFIDVSMTTQILLWSVMSLGMTWLWFAKLKAIWMPVRTLAGQSDPGIVGEIGLTTTALHPFARGTVRFQRPICGSDIWECLTDSDIDVGQRVRIVSIEGNYFKVEPVNRQKQEDSHG